MTKPVLVIIAGGLGSRYGGVKQIEPVDDAGNWFMDYAMYDAMRAGFETAVLVVSPTILDDIRETIGKRVGGNMEIKYSVQRLEDIPVGRLIPEGRVKPWGTGHAAYSARDNIEGPFAVVNADDFYGAD
ncbi:MAG: nucleotidyltransferase, partial [Defluviitaleaceae bacterium]|nr:nucleotidyltransferase [Defluviitaleaceae bacterium]